MCHTGSTDTTVHAEETRLSTNGRSGGNDFFSSQTRASSRPGWVVVGGSEASLESEEVVDCGAVL